jgi:hypothetical protein
MLRRLWISVVSVVLAWFGAAAAQPPPANAGMIGADLAAVRQGSDFFTFFHLEPTGPASPERVTEFRPSGEDFRQLARLTVTVDAGGKITAMTLTLKRSFIDDPTNGVFARDIAKSFLRDAPPAADEKGVSDLADDIEHAGGPFATANYAPKTEAYGVYMGATRTPVVMDLTRTRFSLTPSSEDGTPALTFSFTSR